MLRRLSQNPVRRYWFHRSKGISFTQLKKRGDHTIQQDAPVIFPINASKFDSIQNMEKNRKRTHTHVSIHHVFLLLFPVVSTPLCSPVVVPALWFPRGRTWARRCVVPLCCFHPPVCASQTASPPLIGPKPCCESRCPVSCPFSAGSRLQQVFIAFAATMLKSMEQRTWNPETSWDLDFGTPWDLAMFHFSA